MQACIGASAKLLRFSERKWIEKMPVRILISFPFECMTHFHIPSTLIFLITLTYDVVLNIHLNLIKYFEKVHLQALIVKFSRLTISTNGTSIFTPSNFRFWKTIIALCQIFSSFNTGKVNVKSKLVICYDQLVIVCADTRLALELSIKFWIWPILKVDFFWQSVTTKKP